MLNDMPEHKIPPETKAGRRLTDDEIHGLLLECTDENNRTTLESFLRAMPEDLAIISYDSIVAMIGKVMNLSKEELSALAHARILLWPGDAEIMHYMLEEMEKDEAELCIKCSKPDCEKRHQEFAPEEVSDDEITKAIDDAIKFSNARFTKKLTDEPPTCDKEVN
jgi:hypothetical protein